MEEEVLIRGEVKVSSPSLIEPIYPNRIVLQRKEWERQGVTDLSQLFATIPGVIVLEGDHLFRISLKGSPARTTRVELDRVPLNDPATGEADLSEVPFHHLERVEVEFAPIGGRVGLFTQPSSPSYSPFQWETHGSTGSFGHQEGSIKGAVQRSQREWSGYLNRETERGDFPYYWDDGTRQKRFNNHLSSWIGGASGFDGTRLRMLFSASRRERGVPGLIYSAPTPQAYLKRTRSSFSFQWTPPFFDPNPELQFYYSQQSLFYHNPPFQIHPITGDTVYHWGEMNRHRSKQWGGEAIMVKSTPQWTAKVQFTHRGESYSAIDLYRQKPLSGIGGGDSWRSIYQLGGQFSCKLTPFLPNLIFQFQGEIAFYDQPFSKMDHHFAPGVGVIYRQVKSWGEWSTDLSWGRSFSPPPLASLFTMESLYAVGNPHLSPEEGNGLNWGINYRWKWDKRSFSFRQNLFYRRINNLIVWKRNWQDKFYPQNLDITRAVGGEWHWSWEGGDLPLRWEGGYILNDHRLYRREDVNYLHQV
ncbi:MAG: TonB-dependent receptor plug domain-containing protein, partial [bacterium]